MRSLFVLPAAVELEILFSELIVAASPELSSSESSKWRSFSSMQKLCKAHAAITDLQINGRSEESKDKSSKTTF